MIVEHLAYDPIDETHGIDIFTQAKQKEDLSKGFKGESADLRLRIYRLRRTNATSSAN